MNLHLLEVSVPSLAYIILGGFAVAFSMVSLLIREKIFINEVVLGIAFGVLMGPYVADIFDPRSWGGEQTNHITLEVMRIVLATGLFAIGVELPQSYMADHARGLLVLVVPTMAFGWLIIAGFIVLLFPALNFTSGLAISACLTPTDPIISAAIIGGKFAQKHVPVNVRRILAAESAANDGLAYPFLSIAMYLTLETSRRAAFGKWFLVGWLYQVILGTLLGAVLGRLFSVLMKISHRRGFIDRESYVAQYLALALLTTGVASSLGTDDLLAAFAAGSAISWDGHFNTQTEDEVFSSVIDLLLNCACFIYIGAWLPFNAFNSPSLGITPWRLVVLFVVAMFLRRIPSVLLLYKWVPEIHDWREALVCGHFGPMGVGAVFVSTLALTQLPTPHSPPENQQELLAATMQIIVSFVVLGSVIIHGLSIPSFLFGRRIHSRSVSLTRTWTSRHTSGPDWLLWTRRFPGPSAPQTANASVEDLEAGGAPKKAQTAVENEEEPPLGVAAMVEGDVKDEGHGSAHADIRTEVGREAPLGVAGMIESNEGEELNRKRVDFASHSDVSNVCPPVIAWCRLGTDVLIGSHDRNPRWWNRL
ncbi:Sodium/hydrogen exchanger family-domain-containing protein [Cristinia sonorae]|uniref:Sodium/hydrogen exchanger family-domain-containing protein n=1 Tax=Cristinia sonorae TaxID=1940300 RepID=A0A8K0UH48_9AGAR|nr:Sodium/hydrogen exchanger family-domain-containing protein [Cristinia sonorae]